MRRSTPIYFIDQRNQESGSLSGTSIGQTNEILTRKNSCDRLILNWSRVSVAFLNNASLQRFDYIKIREIVVWCVVSFL